MGITPSEACKKHRGEAIYEVSVHDVRNRTRFCYQSKETDDLYLSFDDAKIAARKVAYDIAWGDQLQKLDHPDYNTEYTTYLACVITGRKFSKNGVLYGFAKIIYAVSHQTKEVTDKFEFDKRFKGLCPNEYTDTPKLTKDMFYQWDEEDEENGK